MNKLEEFFLTVPRRFRRALVLLVVAIAALLVTVVLVLAMPGRSDVIMQWSGLTFGALLLLAEFLYSVVHRHEDREVLPDFDRIFRQTIDIIKWSARDADSEVLITSATPIFGLELEKRQRKQIMALLGDRITSGQTTRLLCLDPRSPNGAEPSPLERFCRALADHADLDWKDLVLRARNDLIEIGQRSIDSRTKIRLGPEPPYNVILARNKTERRGLLYLASASTLPKVGVRGLEVHSREFGEALSQLFEFMWDLPGQADYEDFDSRTRAHLRRDMELLAHHKNQGEVAREAVVGGIKLTINPDVFPSDVGFGIPLILKSIESIVEQEFGDLSREELMGIDVGTGSGILAMKLAEHCSVVYATDNSSAAVKNARTNLTRLKSARGDFDFHVVEGDLLVPSAMAAAKKAKAVLMVFNHPYYPSPLDLYGTLVPDGGGNIVNRFLAQAREVFNSVRGILLMPYSPIAGEHSPLLLASRHKLQAWADPSHAHDDDDVCVIGIRPE